MKVMVIMRTTITGTDFEPPLEDVGSREVEEGDIISVSAACAQSLRGMTRPRVRLLNAEELKKASAPEKATAEASEAAVTPKARGRKVT